MNGSRIGEWANRSFVVSVDASRLMWPRCEVALQEHNLVGFAS